MEQRPTFPWYKPVRGLAILLSSCVGCRGDFPLPAGQSPLSPIDLHLQLFLWESAYLSHSPPPPPPPSSPPAFPLFFLGDAPRRRAVRFPVLFSPSPAPKVPSPVFTEKESRSRIPQDTEFAAHFIITLDGNKLSERRARSLARARDGVRGVLPGFITPPINPTNMLNRDFHLSLSMYAYVYLYVCLTYIQYEK